MTKTEGPRSGIISQRHGSADPDPDPPQNVMDPQHCLLLQNKLNTYKACPTLRLSGVCSPLPRPPPPPSPCHSWRDEPPPPDCTESPSGAGLALKNPPKKNQKHAP
jgi:hypothetical protein